MKRYVTAGLLALALAGCTQTHIPQPRPTPRCEEDQPCWDCRTMGNHICGPTTTEGAELIPPLTITAP
jgi:hypothetical protein